MAAATAAQEFRNVILLGALNAHKNLAGSKEKLYHRRYRDFARGRRRSKIPADRRSLKLSCSCEGIGYDSSMVGGHSSVKAERLMESPALVPAKRIILPGPPQMKAGCQPSERMIMNLRYSGKLTKEEYLAYVKLSNRRILKSGFHIDMWVLFVYLGAFLLLMGLIALVQKTNTPHSSSFLAYLPPLIFIIGISLIGLGLKFRGTLSKYWEENKDSLSNFSGVISDEAIELYTPNGNLKIGWPELNGYGEYMGMIVLYKLPLFAIPFLDRFFEKQEDWHTFKKFVADNLVLTHRVDQDTPSKRKTAYILLFISIVIILVYLYRKGG